MTSSNSVERDSGTTASPLLGTDTTGVQRVEVAAHTAGWTFERIDGRMERPDGMGYVSDSEGRDVLHVGERSLSEQQNVDVGNLAAAAPAMLAALEKIVNNWGDLHPKDRHQARAAINLATGGQL